MVFENCFLMFCKEYSHVLVRTPLKTKHKKNMNFNTLQLPTRSPIFHYVFLDSLFSLFLTHLKASSPQVSSTRSEPHLPLHRHLLRLRPAGEGLRRAARRCCGRRGRRGRGAAGRGEEAFAYDSSSLAGFEDFDFGFSVVLLEAF